MNILEKFIGISLLLFAGCQTTPPMIQPVDQSDPFHAALLSNPFTPPPVSSDFDLQVETEPLAEPPEELEYEEFVFEPEEVPSPSEAELKTLLAQNLWTQNVARINLLDTNRIRSLSETFLEERERRDELNRLNMSEDEWAKRQNQHFNYVDGSVSDWRWMHRGVDQLSAIPPDQRKNVEVFLRDPQYRVSSHRTLQANTAILLGRDGNPAVRRFLQQVVQNETMHVRVRCAAAEVLGRMSTITADDLIPLLDSAKDREVETTHRQTGEVIRQRQPGITELWTELLIAIAEKMEPWEHSCFLDPFYAPTSDIRLEAAKIWRRASLRKKPEGALPDKFLDLARRESNPTIRIEMIKTLGAWQVPDLFTILENDLRHPTAGVRNAAILALADARCREAIPIIKDQLRNPTPAAVAALRKLGVLDDVFKLADSQDAQIRAEIAQALAERCTPQTATLAKSYITDRNVKVQSATLEAVGGWSIDESGELILMAAKSFHADVRRRAIEMLAQRGVAYTGFDPESRPENQTAQYEELVQIFRETVGINPNIDGNSNERSARDNGAIRQVSATVPEDSMLTEVRKCLDDWSDRTLPQQDRELIRRRLTVHGSRLMPMIDHLLIVEKRNIPESLDKVFAEVEPVFQEIERLKSTDLTAKRRAAAELARWGAVNTPSKLAAKRIVDMASRETDVMVLPSLLSALKNADPELVCQLARPLLRSESAEVRRVSCEIIKQFGTRDDVLLLRDGLSDSSRMVVRETLSAIDALLEGEKTAGLPIMDTLKGMLVQGNPATQTEVAATLHRLGYSEGTEALRRLAANPDPSVRAYVARTLPGLEDPVFVPLMLRFLDDSNGTVRSDALKGLPVLTGQDIRRDMSTQQQIDYWRAWGRE